MYPIINEGSWKDAVSAAVKTLLQKTYNSNVSDITSAVETLQYSLPEDIRGTEKELETGKNTALRITGNIGPSASDQSTVYGSVVVYYNRQVLEEKSPFNNNIVIKDRIINTTADLFDSYLPLGVNVTEEDFEDLPAVEVEGGKLVTFKAKHKNKMFVGSVSILIDNTPYTTTSEQSFVIEAPIPKNSREGGSHSVYRRLAIYPPNPKLAEIPVSETEPASAKDALLLYQLISSLVNKLADKAPNDITFVSTFEDYAGTNTRRFNYKNCKITYNGPVLETPLLVTSVTNLLTIEFSSENTNQPSGFETINLYYNV